MGGSMRALALARAEEHGDVEHKPVFGRCPILLDWACSWGTHIKSMREQLIIVQWYVWSDEDGVNMNRLERTVCKRIDDAWTTHTVIEGRGVLALDDVSVRQ